MDHLPIFCQLRQRDCLLVGGGDVAERKARLLLDAGANVTVNALDFTPQFQVWADSQMLTLVQGEFIPSLLDNCWLAIAATDDETVNQQVSEAAEARRIFCNVVDAPRQASFIMPSIIDRSPLMVAISSGGAAPMLARRLREQLETSLGPSLGVLAAQFARYRGRIRSQLPDPAVRRRWFERMLDGRMEQAWERGGDTALKAAFAAELDALPTSADRAGAVVLVEASDVPDLYTLRALRALNEADVIVLAGEVGEPALGPARRDARRIHAHDQPLAPVMDAAASGARVVYLYWPQAAASCESIVRACARAAISCRRVPGVAAFRQ